LRVHHIAWFAMHLQRLGYVPSAEQQASLLLYVAASCEVTKAAAVAEGRKVAPVSPRQLQQLLLLLSNAGWTVEPEWMKGVWASAAGLRLRAWLGQRQQRRKSPSVSSSIWIPATGAAASRVEGRLGSRKQPLVSSSVAAAGP
jgi:hypothetical protein